MTLCLPHTHAFLIINQFSRFTSFFLFLVKALSFRLTSLFSPSLTPLLFYLSIQPLKTPLFHFRLLPESVCSAPLRSEAVELTVSNQIRPHRQSLSLLSPAVTCVKPVTGSHSCWGVKLHF